MSLAFLYNVASCIAYAFATAAYGSLYYVECKRGYLFVALISWRSVFGGAALAAPGTRAGEARPRSWPLH